MNARVPACLALTFFLCACGGSEDAGNGGSAAPESAKTSAARGAPILDALPDPCDWLSAPQAQEILGLPEPPPQTPMGGPQTAGRSCVYTDAGQTAWINVSYEGLNPQVFSAQGKSEQELIDLAGAMYAHGLEHVDSDRTEGYPTLAFQDPDRTIMIVFTDIGKARDLPEGISERFAISSYYNVVMHLYAPQQSGEARLAALSGLVERAVEQLGDVAR